MSPETENVFKCSGFCSQCNTIHALEQDGSEQAALWLMEELASKKNICISDDTPAPQFSTDSLFSEARGKMFGVLKCLDSQGQTVILKAFSGQYNGHWLVPGWVPPLFHEEEFNRINTPTEKVIKTLTAQIASPKLSQPEKDQLKKLRKNHSRRLMSRLHDIYYLNNFKKQRVKLKEAFCKQKGLATGTGDCCAPKLINYAAKNNLIPTGISEFFWGRKNRARTREHGRFYGSCNNNCEPILGFLLCGLDHRESL